MFNGKAMRVHLIAGLIKKHNQISVLPSYTDELIFS